MGALPLTPSPVPPPAAPMGLVGTLLVLRPQRLQHRQSRVPCRPLPPPTLFVECVLRLTGPVDCICSHSTSGAQHHDWAELASLFPSPSWLYGKPAGKLAPLLALSFFKPHSLQGYLLIILSYPNTGFVAVRPTFLRALSG